MFIATTVRTNLNHIKFVLTTTTPSDIKVAAIWTKNNTSPNNYIVVNLNIKKTRTNFVYNRKLDIASIWNIIATNRTNYIHTYQIFESQD
jgi:hypothetical protein